MDAFVASCPLHRLSQLLSFPHPPPTSLPISQAFALLSSALPLPPQLLLPHPAFAVVSLDVQLEPPSEPHPGSGTAVSRALPLS